MLKKGEHNEQDLLKLVTQGDTRAFAELYNRYQPLLTTHLFRITRSEQLAAEYTQDVLLKVWQNRELLGGIVHFKAYLGVMSRNHAIKSLQKLAAQHKHQQAWVQQAKEGAEEPWNEDQKLLNLLDQAIDRLPPQQKKVYLLVRHQRLSYADAGTQLGLSTGTIKRYLQIATASIIEYLHAHAGNQPLGIMVALFILENFFTSIVPF